MRADDPAVKRNQLAVIAAARRDQFRDAAAVQRKAHDAAVFKSGIEPLAPARGAKRAVVGHKTGRGTVKGGKVQAIIFCGKEKPGHRSFVRPGFLFRRTGGRSSLRRLGAAQKGKHEGKHEKKAEKLPFGNPFFDHGNPL